MCGVLCVCFMTTRGLAGESWGSNQPTQSPSVTLEAEATPSAFPPPALPVGASEMEGMCPVQRKGHSCADSTHPIVAAAALVEAWPRSLSCDRPPAVQPL